MDRSILWRSALVQTLVVGVLFAVLALALPREFFEDCGPLGWIAASLVTGRVVGIPLRTLAVASAVAGAGAAVIGVIAAHAVSLPVAIGIFAAICAVRRRPAALPAR